MCMITTFIRLLFVGAMLLLSPALYAGFIVKSVSNINGLTNNSVNCILEDSEHLIWIGTWDGLNAYDGRNLSSFRYSKSDSNSISNNVIRRVMEDGDCIWVATDNGINKLNKKTKKITRYYLGNRIPRQEHSFVLAKTIYGKVYCWVKGFGIYFYDDRCDKFIPINVVLDDSFIDFQIDDENRMLFLTNSGVIRWLQHTDELQQGGNLFFNTLTRSRAIQKMSVSGGCLILIEDRCIEILDGNMEVCHKVGVRTDKGIACAVLSESTLGVGFIGGGYRSYNLDSGAYSVIDEIIEQTSVVTLFKGSQDIWWLGTDGQGVIQLQPHHSLFNTVFTDNPVRCFCSYKEESLLVGTKGSGVKLFNISDKTLSHFLDETHGLASMSIYALAKSCSGDVFIGTEGNGVGILYADKSKVEKLEIPSKYPDFRSVYSLCFTNNDSLLWVGTSGYGLIRMDIRKERGRYKVIGFKQYISSNVNSPLNNDIVYAIAADSLERYVWFGTRGGGLNRIDLIEDKIQSLEDLYSDVQLTNNDVICLSESKNELWIGTSYGLNKLQTMGVPTMVQYAEQLANKTIHGTLQDEKGNIWGSTNQGLFHLNIKTDQIEEYTYNDGLHNDEFADGAYFRDNKNRLFWGGVNGFSYFRTDEIRLRDFDPLLVLDGLKILNATQDLTSRIEDGILHLTYDECSFTLNFLTKDFIKNENCEYAYRFKNYSEEWVYIGTNPNLSFGQLNPGTYELEVRTTNGDKVWGSNIYRLTIKVGYPWWLGTPAVITYVLVCIIIFYITKKVIVGRIRLSRQILIARVETAHEQKIYESKLNFFTDVAHEFFTPLTLIYTPVQYLLDQDGLSDNSKRYLNVIKSNAERMQLLIRELMDFRKAGSKVMELCPEEIDIGVLVDSAVNNYKVILEDNKIDFNVHMDNVGVLYSDRGALEKILFNLLSNAFKYTPRNGAISVDVTKRNDSLCFVIRNTGKGLTEKQMVEIFDRYKIFESSVIGNSVGTGISLNLTKELVELLGGAISVASEVGKYVEFKVSVPPLSSKPAILLMQQSIEGDQVSGKRIETSAALGVARVLIVEDDECVRSLLRDILKSYVVCEALDYESALAEIKQTHPDIIFIDIMDDMDGLAFVQTLKSDLHTSYIPVVVISGCTSLEDQIKACNSGADMFLTKPFHPAQVISTVENLLMRQQSLKDYFNSSLSSVKIWDGKELSPEDEKLLEDVSRIVAEHIDDEKLTPMWIAEALGMSKASLYRKFKEVINKTPGEYVRTIRLEYAAKLLRTTQHTVSEVMFQSGFSNKSYFYREFQKQYGYSPKDYRMREKEGV